MQWVYDGSPLFLWPEIGDNRGKFYFGYESLLEYYDGPKAAMVKDPVAEGFAIPIDDPRVASKPAISNKALVNYGRLQNGTSDWGTAVITTCVDVDGQSGARVLTTSTGSSELDGLSMEFAEKISYVPAKQANGVAITVCGYEVVVDWTESSAMPQKQTQDKPPAAAE